MEQIKYNIPEYATPKKFEVTFNEMGDAILSYDASIPADINPLFSLDWNISVFGEVFKNTTIKPRGIKDNKSLDYKYSLIFDSERSDLKRFNWVDIDSQSGVPLIKSYGNVFKLTLSEFVAKFNENLTYWLGSRWRMQLNPDLVVSNEPVLVNVDKAFLWDVLQKEYELFHERWIIESVGSEMIIKVGYPAKEIQHIFEYGGESDNGGLVSVERVNANEKIVTVLMGRGGEQNVPERYFQPAGNKFPADPDQNSYTASLNIKQLMPKCFRDYNRGWNDKGGIIETGQSDAYYNGYNDVKYKPIEWVKSKEIAIRGEVWDTLDANEEIYPTIQNITADDARAAGISTSATGLLDEIIAVDKITGSDNPEDVKIGSYNKLPAAYARLWANKNLNIDYECESDVWNCSSEFNTLTYNIITKIKDIEVQKMPDELNISVDIAIIDYNTGLRVKTNTNIPIGKYFFKMYVSGYNNTNTTYRLSIDMANVSLFIPSSNLYKPTFDIWIKDIGFDLRKPEYWASSDMTVKFSTGWLSGSEDYEFKIAGRKNTNGEYAEVFVYPDTSKIFNGMTSAWRISLIKSDAEFNTTGKMLPSTDAGHQAFSGDRFFFINIALPHQYVQIAEQRTQEWMETSLAEIDREIPTYTIKPESIFCNNFNETNKLKTGNLIHIYNKNLVGDTYANLHIQSITLKFDPTKLNIDWDLVVSDKITPILNSVQLVSSKIDELTKNKIDNSNITPKIISICDTRYLRKDGLDEKSYSKTAFVEPILAANYTHGDFSGSGWGIYTDANGNTVLETDRAVFRKDVSINTLNINQVNFTLGETVFSNGGCLIVNVEDKNTFWRCHYDSKNGTQYAGIKVDDQVRCQSYDSTNTNITKYYWRLVIDVGDTHIDLSKTDCDGVGIPTENDNIVQFGNRTDKTRQSAIVLDPKNGGSNVIYAGINSYELTGRNFVGYGVNANTGEAYNYTYGDWFAGDRNIEDADATFITYQKKRGDTKKKVRINAELNIGSGSSGLSNLSEWQGKQNEIDNAQQTANDAKAAAAAAANTATQTNTAVVNLTSYIDGAFADGIIETSEANAIATYINNINEAKATADSSYTTVYANPLLSGGAKTNLSTAKSNLDTARTALLSSINTAIADRKTTVAEKADVDAKFASYNAAYGVFTTRLQDAGKSIENIINQTATDAAQAAKNSQQAADKANALLADIANDNRLSPSEKSTTKKEWETIALEKPTIIAQADIYHISTADYASAYNALNSYLTPLLSDLTITSDIVGVTFRERFTTYYTYRTGLLKAVAEAAKGYVDNIEIGGRNLLRNSALTTLNGNTSYAAGWIVKLKKGQKYTLSYDSTTIVEQQGYPQFYIWSRVWEDPTKPIMFLGSVVESKSRSFTCALNDGEYFLDVFVHIYPMPDKQIIKIQLEEGDKATTWREAPEDTAYTIAGRNYLMNSRYDKVGMFDLHGGVTKRVSDPELGDVVEYSRPINVGEFMTNHKFTNLPNQDVVYYVVAKLISGTGDFAFGGWSETTTGVSASCEYINLGNGWRQYYRTFKSGANLASGGTFGINSVAGTWQFYAAGILKGKDVTVWAASPEDIKARVDNFEYLKETFEDSHTEVTGGAMLTSFIGVRDGEVVRAGMTSGEHGLPFFFADADGAKNAASAGFTVSREAFVRSGGADGSIFLENGRLSLCSMVADGAGNRGDSEQVYLTGREFDTDANNPFTVAINAHKRANKSYTIHKQVVCDVTITEQDLNPQTHLAETNILTKVLNSFYCGKQSAGITNSVEINSVTLTITKTGKGTPSVAIGWAMCNPWYCPFAYDSAGHIAESNWVACPTGTVSQSYTLPFRGFISSYDFIYHIASSISIKDAAAGDHIIVALTADPVVTVQYNPSINALHYGNGSVAFQDLTHYAGIASDGVNSLVAQRNGNQGFKADIKGQACWSTDRNGWDYTRLLLTGRIAANGLISYQSGMLSFTVRRAGTGVYIVTHDKGDQNYTVSVTPWSDSDSRIVCNVGAISNNSFAVHMIGSQGGIYDCGFMLQMFGY